MSSQTEIFPPSTPRRIPGSGAAPLLLAVAAVFVLTAALAPALDKLTADQPAETPQLIEDWHGNSASIRPAAE